MLRLWDSSCVVLCSVVLCCVVAGQWDRLPDSCHGTPEAVIPRIFSKQLLSLQKAEQSQQNMLSGGVVVIESNSLGQEISQNLAT